MLQEKLGSEHHKLRGAERLASEMRAQIVLDHVDDESPIPVILHDISTDGAGLTLGHELKPGIRLLLMLPRIHDRTLSLNAHVVQSRQLEPGRHRIGVQFDPHGSTALERLRDTLPM